MLPPGRPPGRLSWRREHRAGRRVPAMGLLSTFAGAITDAALGLPLRGTPYTVARDVAVPMPDGVALLGDHYRPAGADGGLPVVLIRLPYGRAGLFARAFAAPYARRGFQGFVQSTRGTFGSGGQFRPFTTEREDGLATLAWLRAQPWCDGRVAMTGGSYFGHTQWAVAPYADPPLVAVSPHITAARITTAFYDHGTPGLENALRWSAAIGRQEAGGLPAPLPRPGVRARIERALRQLPLQAADTAAVGAPVPFWRDFTSHAAPGDPFWDTADHDDADLSRFPPANMVTGWWDLFAAAQLTDYARLRAAGVPARITLGPRLHGDPGELKEIVRTDVTWLDHHLRGAPAPAGPPCGCTCSRPTPGSSWSPGHPRAAARSTITSAPAAPSPSSPRTATRSPVRSHTTLSTPLPASAARCSNARASRPTTVPSRPATTSLCSPDLSWTGTSMSSGTCAPACMSAPSSSTPTCSSGCATSTRRAFHATSSAGSTRVPCPLATSRWGTTACLPWTSSCSLPLTASAPGTGCGCRSPAARSLASPATSAPASRSPPRLPAGAATSTCSTTRRTHPGWSCPSWVDRPGHPTGASARSGIRGRSERPLTVRRATVGHHPPPPATSTVASGSGVADRL